jgi:large subunit ribosomal protein L24
MKKTFSTAWKASKQPRKQRKYRHNAPMHTLGKFASAMLSETLVTKHKVKSTRVRTGDKVKVMRGKFKGTEGKVELINMKKSTVKIAGVEVSKKDGSKAKVPVHISNLMITGVESNDKHRFPKQK